MIWGSPYSIYVRGTIGLRVQDIGIVLNYCQYGVLYLGSYDNTGPYINFPHFGNSREASI